MTPRHSLRDSSRDLTRSWRGGLPAGGRDALRQLVILLSAYAAYDVARVVVRGRESVAMANAQGVINAEKAMHLYVEPWMQAMASHVHAFVQFMDWFYADIHIPATILLLTWIYLYRHETFGFFRNVFLIMNALAMTGFAMMPVAPPRLVPTSGIVDTLFLYSTTSYRSGVLGFVTNQYAALPSLHIGYALFLTIAVWLLTTNRMARVLAAVYPLVVFIAIIVTGNHYWIDAAAGVVVVVVAFAATYAFVRGREPEAVPIRVDRDE